jgi:hypothetical protein
MAPSILSFGIGSQRAVSYFYRESLGAVDGAYFQEYHECFEQTKPVKKWLLESLLRLHTEALETEKLEGRVT